MTIKPLIDSFSKIELYPVGIDLASEKKYLSLDELALCFTENENFDMIVKQDEINGRFLDFVYWVENHVVSFVTPFRNLFDDDSLLQDFLETNAITVAANKLFYHACVDKDKGQLEAQLYFTNIPVVETNERINFPSIFWKVLREHGMFVSSGDMMTNKKYKKQLFEGNEIKRLPVTKLVAYRALINRMSSLKEQERIAKMEERCAEEMRNPWYNIRALSGRLPQDIQQRTQHATTLIEQFINYGGWELVVKANQSPMAMIDVNPKILAFIQNPNDEVIDKALSRDPSCIQYVLAPKHELQMLFAEKYPQYLMFINNPCQEIVERAKKYLYHHTLNNPELLNWDKFVPDLNTRINNYWGGYPQPKYIPNR